MAPFVEEDETTAPPVPPTRPSTPTFDHHRLDRIAEAPSRADPNLPQVEISSPIQAPPAPMAFPDHGSSTTNGNGTAGEKEPSASQESNVSPKILFCVHLFVGVLFANASIRLHIPLSRLWPFGCISTSLSILYLQFRRVLLSYRLHAFFLRLRRTRITFPFYLFSHIATVSYMSHFHIMSSAGSSPPALLPD
jgi:hypothetical protein